MATWCKFEIGSYLAHDSMNGVLLFGWSTAVIFEVLRRIMMRDPDNRAFK
jgi:hypothetical protein